MLCPYACDHLVFFFFSTFLSPMLVSRTQFSTSLDNKVLFCPFLFEWAGVKLQKYKQRVKNLLLIVAGWPPVYPFPLPLLLDPQKVWVLGADCQAEPPALYSSSGGSLFCLLSFPSGLRSMCGAVCSELCDGRRSCVLNLHYATIWVLGPSSLRPPSLCGALHRQPATFYSPCLPGQQEGLALY